MIPAPTWADAAGAEWTAEFRARYAEWWREAERPLAAHDYGTAFKTYPWPTFATTPWTPVTKPLGASRLAVVTTGRLYRPGVDPPFEAGARRRTWSNAQPVACD